MTALARSFCTVTDFTAPTVVAAGSLVGGCSCAPATEAPATNVAAAASRVMYRDMIKSSGS